MLLSLEIQNFALIENLSMRFEEGLSIITGQTGSGKSVLLQALGLALGERADHQALRDPEEKCIVEAVFRVENRESRIENREGNGKWERGEGKEKEVILRRMIYPGGKSRIFLNDAPTTLEEVQKMARMLIDIHQQHQHLVLKDEKFVLDLLDGLGGHGEVLHQYQEAYGDWKEVDGRYQALLLDIEKNRADYDFLKVQLEDFAGLDFEHMDLEALEEEYKLQSSGEASQRLLQQLQEQALTSQEALTALTRTSQDLAKSLPKAEAWQERSESLRLDLEDFQEEVRRSSSGFSYDPARAAELETMLGKVYGLQKRHQRFSVEDLGRLEKELQTRIASVDHFETAKQQLEEELSGAREALGARGKALQEARQRSAQRLEQRLGELLGEVGMGESLVKTSFASRPEPSLLGLEKVVLLYAPHHNMPPKGLSDIASGGELSRLMLCLKSLMAEHMDLPTILFDEIDVGVSGVVAEKVGQMLKQMARHRQVMTITHLPQVAARGDHHFKIFKDHDETAAYTRMRTLSRTDRLEEIAQMISGKEVTESAVEQARSMLQ